MRRPYGAPLGPGTGALRAAPTQTHCSSLRMGLPNTACPLRSSPPLAEQAGGGLVATSPHEKPRWRWPWARDAAGGDGGEHQPLASRGTSPGQGQGLSRPSKRTLAYLEGMDSYDAAQGGDGSGEPVELPRMLGAWAGRR
jgi:hypothetical protein